MMLDPPPTVEELAAVDRIIRADRGLTFQDDIITELRAAAARQAGRHPVGGRSPGMTERAFQVDDIVRWHKAPWALLRVARFYASEGGHGADAGTVMVEFEDLATLKPARNLLGQLVVEQLTAMVAPAWERVGRVEKGPSVPLHDPALDRSTAPRAPTGAPSFTIFECRCCDASTSGKNDGSFDAPGWGRIENITGPNAICPRCKADPTALDGLKDDGYPAACIAGADR